MATNMSHSIRYVTVCNLTYLLTSHNNNNGGSFGDEVAKGADCARALLLTWHGTEMIFVL